MGVECVNPVNTRISVKVLEAVAELGFRSQRSEAFKKCILYP